jgi:hypothetical protein
MVLLRQPCPTSPKDHHEAPVHSEKWNAEPTTDECCQIPVLQARIKKLRELGLTTERVAFLFMKHRIQPWMKREKLGFEYCVVSDPSRFTAEEISDKVIIERLKKIFKTWRGPEVVEYSAERPPKPVSSCL